MNIVMMPQNETSPAFPQKYFWMALLCFVFVPLLVSFSLIYLAFEGGRQKSNHWFFRLLGHALASMTFFFWMALSFGVGYWILGVDGLLRMPYNDLWNFSVMMGFGILVTSSVAFVFVQLGLMLSLGGRMIQDLVLHQQIALDYEIPTWHKNLCKSLFPVIRLLGME